MYVVHVYTQFHINEGTTAATQQQHQMLNIPAVTFIYLFFIHILSLSLSITIYITNIPYFPFITFLLFYVN